MKFSWKMPNADNFTAASEWTPSSVPGAFDQVFLAATGTAYDVNVTNGDTETVLTISTSADATLNIINNSRFTAEEGTGLGANNGTIQVSDTSVLKVAGTINNNGSIELLGSGAGASLVLLGDTTLNGGALSLSGDGENFILGGGTLTNADNSHISGAGQIDVAVVNKAQIDATSDSAPLQLNGTVTNTGDLRGDGSQGLLLECTVNNTGGLIEGFFGLVQLGVPGTPGTIIGGTIEGLGGSGVFLLQDGSLDGSGAHPITIADWVSAGADATVDAAGAFKTNIGILTLEANSSLLLGLSNAAAADTTFSGGTYIVMNSATIDLNPLTHAGSAPPKLNNVDEVIRGTGTIGSPSSPGSIVLNNEVGGMVAAINGTLSIYCNVTNAGVLDATAGTLVLGGNTVNNTGSLSAGAGNIALEGTTIHGGTLTGAGSGVFDVGGGAFGLDGAVLDGSTSMLTNFGIIDVHTAFALETRTLTVKGTIKNNGRIQLGPSGTGGAGTFAGPIPIGSDLVIGATGKSTQVTLKGGGSIVLDAYGDDYIIGDAGLPGGVPTTLDNVNDTIIGVGRIGDDGLTLKNSGFVDADTAGTSASPLVIDTGARTVTNTGTLTAFDKSTLYIDSPLNNTGGNLTETRSGDLIAEQGAIGGTATLFEGGTIEFGGPTTTAVQFASSALFSAGALVLDDSIHFKGVIRGFAKANINDEIDLNDIDAATAHKVSFALGVLTIKDGEGHTAQLHFSGTYTLGSFNLNDDGHGGTLLTDPPAAPSANAALFGSHIAAAFPSTAPFQDVALSLSPPPAARLLAPPAHS